MTRGFEAFQARDIDALNLARNELPPVLACQHEALPPAVTARVLGFDGLGAGAEGRDLDVAAYWRGAASVAPEFPFRELHFVPNTFYDKTWKEAVSASEPEPVQLLDLVGEEIDRRIDVYVNGVKTRSVLPDRYSVVQVRIRPREVIASFALPPDDHPRLPPIQELQDALGERARVQKKRRAYAISGGAAATAALISEGVGRATQRRSDGEDWDPTAFQLHQAALVLGGASAGMLALGLTVAR